MLKSSDFRRIYEQGRKLSSPLLTVLVLAVERAGEEGPRVGFTVPRAFGKAVKRNRAKRRIRELLRVRLGQIDRRWDLVIHPKRPVLDASPEELQREVERLLSRCDKL